MVKALYLNMHRLIFGLLLGTTPLLTVTASEIKSSAYGDQEKVLNIFNWADYIDPQILIDFEQEYGIRVNYDIYDAGEVVDIKLMAGRSGYDIVIHSASASSRLQPAGIYHPIDYSRLTNWHHVDKQLVSMAEQHYSNAMEGVPYMWGTTGIAYNVDMVNQRMPDAPLDSARLVFDPQVIAKFADCGVSIC